MAQKKKTLIFGLTATGIYLLVQLLLMPHYGLSWDFHNHYYAGLFHLGLPVPRLTDPAPVPFSPPDPRATVDEPFGPFTQVIPTLSHVLFYERLHLLSYDNAYNLPMVMVGSLGVGLIFVIALEWFGTVAAWTALLSLALLPVHFGYLHTNMKDVPDAFFFALSVFLFWRLTRLRRLRDLSVAVVSFAVAFNIKVNAVLIPVVCGGYFLWHWLVTKKYSVRVAWYFFWAPLAALAVWWPFWSHPWAKLLEFPEFYSHNTLNMPVLLAGNIYQSGVNIPWYYPYLYVGITTPPVILFLVLLGVVICFRGAWKKDDRKTLLLLWFFIPLVRYSLPGTPAIDGVRHFMEIVYPLCLFSAVGAAGMVRLLPSFRFRYPWLVGLFCLPLLANVYHYHPYETSYFNLFVGGIRGAAVRYDIDFWGTPQREAVRWLNTNAPVGATIHIVMAQSTAAVYLRPDLLQRANTQTMHDSDYTVLLNRESFFSMYAAAPYVAHAKEQGLVVFTVQIDGVPLVWVIKNH